MTSPLRGAGEASNPLPDSRAARTTSAPYRWPQLFGDLLGGFIASLIAFPYGLALASLMGLPPMLGVFTSIFTAPFTVLLGRNPVMIGGVSSVTVPFIAGAVRAQGIAGAVKVCTVAAVVMLVFSALRLGRYAARVPHTVMAGFSCGIGGIMILSQLRAMMGLPADAHDSSAGAQIMGVLRDVSYLQWKVILVALIVIALAALATRLSPRLPAPLIGIAAAATIANLLGWSTKQIGSMPTGFPPLAAFSWHSEDIRTILPAGFGLAFVASVNLLLTSRVVEHFRGRHEAAMPVDADRELTAYGVANIAGALFGAPLSVGIPARSLANVQCGATTRLSNIFHAAFLLLFVVQASHLIAHLPLAALAAVTAWMGFRLMEWSTWRRLHKMRRVDAAAFLSTAFAAVFLNAILAVALGCSMYFIPWAVLHFGKTNLRVEPPALESTLVVPE